MLGTVKQLWRYPVKSMAGNRLSRCFIGPKGIPGDRGWALRDEKAGEIRGAKKIPQLLQFSAAYLEEPSQTRVAPVEIVMPDGTRVRSDDPAAAERLSRTLGRPVTLWPLQPAEARDHYRRGAPDNADLTAELRAVFGRLESEPLPDFSAYAPELLNELMEFASPLGTYFDAFPIHLITSASLAAMAKLNSSSSFDVRRFRPNLLMETRADAVGFEELRWCGKKLRVGEAVLKVEIPCARCVMTTLEQHDLPKDPSVLRTIVRDADQNLGVYATVVTPGHLALGDKVSFETAT